MRLICPNCGAQYEVPDEVIPQDGRDVQCSNCGDTWFQVHPDHDEALAEELDVPMPVVASEPEDDPDDSDDADGEDDGEDDAPSQTDAPETADPEPKKSDLDPAVSDILRQEAEHEAGLRAKEGSAGLETQPDLGLQEAEDDAGRRTREARERMAKMRGETAQDVAEATAAAALGSRRDLLPDIEEINSTLRSASDRQSEASGDEGYSEPQIAREKSRFRRGFSMIVLLAVIMTAVYVLAPKIGSAIPQAEPVLNSYVIMIDKGRMALNAHVNSVLKWLDTTADEAASE
jgi:predicted Zn finger-like uncharacterized protein